MHRGLIGEHTGRGKGVAKVDFFPTVRSMDFDLWIDGWDLIWYQMGRGESCLHG